MGTDDERRWLEILRSHLGFETPEDWVDYARTNAFKRVAATPVVDCPDCGAAAGAPIAQYVYYSNLIRLRHCAGCELVYADVHLDPDVVQQHFEHAYKDERYFSSQRTAIFDEIARGVDGRVGSGARVIDIGGAKGHLLSALRDLRPDLELCLADISEEAYSAARGKFGLCESAQKYMIFYTKLTPVVYTSAIDSGILLTIRYLTAPRNRRDSSQEIWEAILREFAHCDDIDFAYPTQRFFHNPTEGKPGMQSEVEAGPQPSATPEAPRT